MNIEILLFAIAVPLLLIFCKRSDISTRLRITIFVAAMFSGTLPYVRAAQQQTITSHVSRSDAFTLGNAQFEPSTDWTAVFCKTQDPRRCTVSRITVTGDKYGMETLGNGQLVPQLGFNYTSPLTIDWPYMFIKGLPIKEGEISNVLAERQLWILGGGRPTNPYSGEPDPVSLTFGTETFQFRLDFLNLVIEEHGKTSAKQTVPLFIDPDKRCTPSPLTPDTSKPYWDLRREASLRWMGDLDGDGRADFLLWASAYRSCALPISLEDPEDFLILSSKGAKGEVGMVVPAVGYRRVK
jgi:hypothetical protein